MTQFKFDINTLIKFNRYSFENKRMLQKMKHQTVDEKHANVEVNIDNLRENGYNKYEKQV